MTQKGLYIAFEGLEGCGKSTQIQAIKERFNKLSLPHVTLREPGSTPEAETLRELLNDNLNLSNDADMILFSIARKSLHDHIIRDAIASGQHVLSDRSIFSTITMQCHTKKDQDLFLKLNKALNPNPWPDIVIILCAPYDTTVARANQRDLEHNTPSRLGGRPLSYFARAAEVQDDWSINGITTADPNLYQDPIRIRINAHQNITDVTRDIWNALEPHIPT